MLNMGIFGTPGILVEDSWVIQMVLLLTFHGYIFVTDKHIKLDGVFIDSFGSKGSSCGQFLGPYGIAIGPTGDIYIYMTTEDNKRIQIFST